MKKLIFFDIDGTLITEGSEHYVPESTEKALGMLRENGHICIINTGRTYAALDDTILGIDVAGYVCGCGTYVMTDGEVLMSRHIDKALCENIAYELDRCNMEWIFEGEKALYFSERNYRSRIWNDIEGYKKKLHGNLYCISEKDYGSIVFDKFCLSVGGNSDFESFYRMFSDRFTFIDRGGNFYEIVPKGFSKAEGMKFLENRLGIPHSDTFAVGDSSNDISMLEYAAVGILMGNADPSLHKFADFVTSSVTEDGIYRVFRHYGLI